MIRSSFLLALGFLVLSGPQASADPYRRLVTLPANGLSGQAAIDALGAQIRVVAGAQGRTASELMATLLKDPTLKIDRYGWLYYAEDPSFVPEAGPSNDPALMSFALSDTFTLHSQKLSGTITNSKIYLNFKGGTLSGTAWNDASGLSQIILPPFDTDGDPSAFSDDELRAIQLIWQRVAEDFAPFGVDVTTDPYPWSAGPLPLPNKFRTVMVTASTAFSPCECPAASYASNPDDESLGPALVFHDRLRGSGKFIAEAITHQLGHRFGLDHDGTSSAAQYAGAGSWAPIMGRNYLAARTQFSKGDYPGASNLQDDIAIIRKTLGSGLPSRGDSQYDSTRLGYSADPARNRLTAETTGRLTQQDDGDYYEFPAGTGLLIMSARPLLTGSNARLQLSLYDDTGKLLRRSEQRGDKPRGNPALTYSAPRPGTFYVRVAAIGMDGTPQPEYTSYGSRGYYVLKLNAPLPDRRLPTVQATATPWSGVAPVSVTLRASPPSRPEDAGRLYRYVWDLGNGTTAGPASENTIGTSYSAVGTYTVKLKVIDDAGFSTSTGATIVAGRGLRAPQFRIINRNPVAPGLISFDYVVDPNFFDQTGNRLPAANAKVLFGVDQRIDPARSRSLTGSTSWPCNTPFVVQAIEIGGVFYIPPASGGARLC